MAGPGKKAVNPDVGPTFRSGAAVSTLIDRYENLHRFLETNAHNRARSEPDLVALGRHHDARAGAGANGATDGRAFSAAGNRANHRTRACADADLLGVLFLCWRR